MGSLNCNFCKSCNFCDSCDYCDFCKSCNSCNYCYDCKNLVNGFMCSKIKLSKKDKNKYWLFNKEVSKEEFGNRYELGFEEKPKVCSKCGQTIKEDNE